MDHDGFDVFSLQKGLDCIAFVGQEMEQLHWNAWCENHQICLIFGLILP